IESDIGDGSNRPVSRIDSHPLTSGRAWHVNARGRGSAVLTREEVGERVIHIVLRRLVIEADAVIQREPAVHFPIVLNVELGVPVSYIERGAGGGLLVDVHIAH